MTTPRQAPAEPEIDLRIVDARLEQAGLSRAPRRREARANGREAKRPERVVAEELEPTRTAIPRVAGNGVPLLPAPGWEKHKWLWHGFSTRRGGLSRAYAADGDGELNLGFTADDDGALVAANRRLLAEAVTSDAETPIVNVHQVHSNIVVRVGREQVGKKPHRADGVMTDEPGMLIGVLTADCIPVLVADRKRRAVAAFHAGWRGTVSRIVEAGIGRMRMEFGSKPEDLVAAIGPGVGQCCYSVGEEVLAKFESQFAYGRELFVQIDETDPVRRKYVAMFLNQRAPGHGIEPPRLHLDLIEANRRQLLDAGLGARAIKIVAGCTNCDTGMFFSHRASPGKAGRMMSVIGVKVDGEP